MKKNFFFNLIGMALPIVSSLVTVPIYIHHMGVERYGVLSVVWILLGYLGLVGGVVVYLGAGVLFKTAFGLPPAIWAEPLLSGPRQRLLS